VNFTPEAKSGIRKLGGSNKNKARRREVTWLFGSLARAVNLKKAGTFHSIPV
jgi:hypothetical protein